MRHITYERFEPAHQQWLEMRVERWGRLIPLWCSSLWFEYRPEGLMEDEVMRICINYPYRQAIILASPLLFDVRVSEALRERYLVHEFMHLAVEPLAEWAKGNLERLLDDAPKYRETVIGELRDRVESIVQDLAHGILDDSWPEVKR